MRNDCLINIKEVLIMPDGTLPPMEDQASYGGFFGAVVETWKQACLRPAEFFQKVGNSQDLQPALIYGVLMGWIGSIFSMLPSLVFSTAASPLMSGQNAAGEAFTGLSGLACVVAVGWLVSLIALFISSGIYHLFLMLYKGANESFNQTLRVVCYAQGPQLLNIIPYLGGLIAGIWMIILTVIGLAAVHRTDQWRALFAILTPVILIVLCACFVFIALGAALFGGIRSSTPIPAP